MSRQSGTSNLKQRKKVVDVHCSEPATADPKPGDILRKRTVPGKTRVQILVWVLLALWAVAAAFKYKKLVARTRATYQEGTCSSTCSARPPSIRSTDIVSNSSKASVVLGRQPVSAERGQLLHQRPALAPSLGPYPWPSFYTLPDTGYAPPAFAELHSDIRPNPYIVIAYNHSFYGTTWQDQQRKCPIPCFISSNTDKWAARADVLVFHAPTMDLDVFVGMIPDKPPNQLWALHSMESAGYYPFTSNSDFMQFIDIQATPKLRTVVEGADLVPSPYFNNEAYSNWTLQRPEMHNKTRFALWMHNNCASRSQREVLVQQLMRYIPVDSPGTCLHNHDPPGAAHKGDPLALLASYKFYIMFENAIGENDWVSSTYFRTLDAGTVPVYLGAPNILKFAPAERSVIRACDFDSVEDLADYLLYLDRNETAYNEYLSWKKEGPSEEFQALMQVTEPSTFCSMCMVAAQRKLGAYDEEKQTMVGRHMQALQDFQQLNSQLQRERSPACRGKTRWWVVPFKEELLKQG